MKKLLIYIVLVIIGCAVVKWLQPTPAKPGELLATEPLQSFAPWFPRRINGFTMFPVASYELDGRVLSRCLYSDDQSDVSPVDLAMGWGPMSRDSWAEKVSVSQGGRFYEWTYEDRSLDKKKIIQSSANVHIIPATPELKQFLCSVLPGQYLSLKGSLVFVYGEDGWHWISSMSRNDSGDGACELFYVESVQVFQPGQSVPANAAATPVQGKPAPAAKIAPRSSDRVTKPVEVVLRSELEVPLKHGILIIPAHAKISILGRKGDQTNARYQGMTFWIRTNDIPL